MGFTRPSVIYRHMEVPVIYQNFGCPEHLVGRQKNWQVGTCFVIALSGEVPAPKMCRIVNRFSFVQILCVCVYVLFFFLCRCQEACALPKDAAGTLLVCCQSSSCFLHLQYITVIPLQHALESYSNRTVDL